MEVTRVPPERDGVIDAGRMTAAVRPDTVLACLMLANNELGTIQPVAEVAVACRERGVPLLCDAVQAAGKIAVDVQQIGADFVTVGAHKFHGPLGAAALWMRRGQTLEGLLVGGGQERRRRASTENVPAIVGLGKAAALARAELEARHERLRALRDRFEAGLCSGIPQTVVHCASSPRLPHTSQHRHPRLRRPDPPDPARPARLRGVGGLGVLLGSDRAQQDAPRARPAARGGALLAAGELRHGKQRGRGGRFLEVLAEEVAALRGSTVGAPLIL